MQRSRLPWWVLLLIWAGLLSWLSLTPRPPRLEMGFLSWDKFLHAGAYGLFTLLAGGAMRSFDLEKTKRWFLAALAAVVFGGAIEILQGAMTAVRSAEWGDMVANALGAGLVFWGASRVLPFFRGKAGHKENKELVKSV